MQAGKSEAGEARVFVRRDVYNSRRRRSRCRSGAQRAVAGKVLIVPARGPTITGEPKSVSACYAGWPMPRPVSSNWLMRYPDGADELLEEVLMRGSIVVGPSALGKSLPLQIPRALLD
jgi:hypothetical protein